MGRQTRPAQVYQNAKGYLASKMMPTRVPVQPMWLRAVEAVPPSESLSRPYPIQHTEPNPRARRPKNTFRPTKIVYPEDSLRQGFFKDHPWELARPAMALELDGKDARGRDWSTGIRQPNLPLSGECVVQRQLWLMDNKGKTRNEAYDMARREFYEERQLEEIERRIAAEEARMVGAYFGMSAVRLGLMLEDKQHENWKVWAESEYTKMQAQRSEAYTSFGSTESPEEEVEEQTPADN